MEPRKIRIGTRKSPLALWQARHVAAEIESLFPGTSCELVLITTTGDKILDAPLAKVGGKGLFVKEIENALLAGEVDLAVHSMKDVPARLPEGLVIGAVMEREDPRDVLVCRTGRGLDDLPRAGRIGTSSLRRSAQLLHLMPDLEIVPLRGNVGTRLDKLESQNLDAVVLAAAGMKRLGFAARITQFLPPETLLPAVAQGALGLEVRADDPDMEAVTRALNHGETARAVAAERAFLARLGGSCQVPVAAHATLSGNFLSLTGLVADLPGTPIFRETKAGPADKAETLGEDLAEKLVSRGAGEILTRLGCVQA